MLKVTGLPARSMFSMALRAFLTAVSCRAAAARRKWWSCRLGSRLCLALESLEGGDYLAEAAEDTFR